MTLSPASALLLLCSINGALFALVAAILTASAHADLPQILAATLITFCLVTALTLTIVTLFASPQEPKP